eukprot:Ihof_evm5s49 gene=Ihof_evmTU5s49
MLGERGNHGLQAPGAANRGNNSYRKQSRPGGNQQPRWPQIANTALHILVKPEETLVRRTEAACRIAELLGTSDRLEVAKECFDRLLQVANVLLVLPSTKPTEGVEEEGQAELWGNIQQDLVRSVMALGHEAACFFPWVFQQLSLKGPSGVVLLSALLQVLEGDEARMFVQYLPVVVEGTRTALDASTSPAVVSRLVQLISQAKRVYPDCVSPFFEEIVDMLLGWYLDPSTPDILTGQILDVLADFKPFWLEHFSFTLHFINQVLKDMTEIADLLRTGSVALTDEAVKSNLLAFIRVFTIMVGAVTTELSPQSVGAQGTASARQQVTPGYLDTLGRHVSGCYAALAASDPHADILPEANHMVEVVARSTGTYFGPHAPLVFDYVLLTLDHAHLSISLLRSALLMLRSVVQSCGKALPEMFVKNLLGTDRKVMIDFIAVDATALAILLDIYRDIFKIHSMSLCDHAFALLSDWLHQCYKRLLLEGITGSQKAGEMETIFAATVIQQSVVGHSFMGMWVPTLLSLLTVTCSPAAEGLAVTHPSAQAALLKALTAFTKSCSYFLPIKERPGDASVSVSGITLGVQRSYDGLDRVVEIYANIIRNPCIPPTTLLCAVEWVSTLGQVVRRQQPKVREDCQATVLGIFAWTGLVNDLCQLVGTVEIDVRLAACQALTVLLEAGLVAEAALVDVASEVVPALGDHNPEVRLAAIQGTATLPSWVYRYYDGQFQGWGAQRAIIGAMPGPALRPQHFEAIMSGLLGMSVQSDSTRLPAVSKPDWLLQLFYTSRGLVSEPQLEEGVESLLVTLLGRSWAMVWHWALNECARYCILFRRRVIVTFNNVVHTDTKSKAGETSPEERIHMSNAIDGFVTMYGVPKNVTIFFHANAKVCTDWLGRIRPVLLMLAVETGMPSAAIRYGMLSLEGLYQALHPRETGSAPTITVLQQDHRRQLMAHRGDALWTLVHTVEALLTLRDGSSIQGLYDWCSGWTIPGETNETTRVDAHWVDWLQPCAWLADMHYELALAEFRRHIEAYPEGIIHDFLAARITDCETALCWGRRYEGGSDVKGQPNESGHYLDALCGYDQGQLVLAQSLLNKWMTSITEDRPGTTTWPESLCRGKGGLLHSMINMRITKSVVASPNTLQHFVPKMELVIALDSARSWTNYLQYVSLTRTLVGQPQRACGALIGQVINSWDSFELSSFFTAYRAALALGEVEGKLPVVTDMVLYATGVARKNGNLQTAHNLLGCLEADPNWPSILMRLTPQLMLEKAKVLKASGQSRQALVVLGNLLNHKRGDHGERLWAKGLCRLAKWLADDPGIANCEALWEAMGSDLTQTIKAWPGSAPDLASLGAQLDTLNPVDRLYGACAWLTCTWAPDHAQAMYRYGNWCYQQAQQQVQQCTANQLGSLTVPDQQQIKDILLEDDFLSSDPCSTALTVVTEVMASVHRDLWRLIVLDNTSERPKDDLRVKLQQELDGNITDVSLDRLVSLQRQIHGRLLSLFATAASAFFQYLHLGAMTTKSHQSHEVQARKQYKTDSCVLTTTLRLLKMLCIHGTDLAHIFSDMLPNSPAIIWRPILPQVFARLGHTDSYVQGQVASLLGRVGRSWPQSVLYRVLAGLRGEESSSPLHSQLLLVQEELRAHSQPMVNAMSTLLDGLAQLAALWDDRWLDCLNHIQADAARRLARVMDITSRLVAKEGLPDQAKITCLRNYYEATIWPLCLELERVVTATIAGSAETINEQMFMAQYGPQLKEALQRLQCPSVEVLTSANEIAALWKPFRKVQQSITGRMQKRNTATLSLATVSPCLMGLDHNLLYIPGQQQAYMGYNPPTIATFVDTVMVLPTKTRPKKVGMVGSDGKQYWFLYKGVEDMRLDERIMQLMNTINIMLAQYHPAPSVNQRLRCHTTVVIPLGPKSGMIQWVEGMVTLFTLYKHWQQHNLAITNMATVNRPVEIYNAKIEPALRQKGLSLNTPRKDWPPGLAVKVLQELISETPFNLISREMWAATGCPGEWFRASNHSIQTTAAMSMVGYVIGLGDRHMDNILMDFSCGKVLHVDYNVCFEKGLRLRVPECVPFRMTQNLQHALGPAGVKGPFRSLSVQVMTVLRQNKETLLTLLEAFIYDPLVDWTVVSADQEKRELALAGAIRTFGAYIVEHKALWDAAHDNLVVKALPRLREALISEMNPARARKGTRSLAGIVQTVTAATNKTKNILDQAKPYLEGIARSATALDNEPSSKAIHASTTRLLTEHSQFCEDLGTFCNLIVQHTPDSQPTATIQSPSLLTKSLPKGQGKPEQMKAIGGPKHDTSSLIKWVDDFIRTAERMNAQKMALAQAAQPSHPLFQEDEAGDSAQPVLSPAAILRAAAAADVSTTGRSGPARVLQIEPHNDRAIATPSNLSPSLTSANSQLTSGTAPLPLDLLDIDLPPTLQGSNSPVKKTPILSECFNYSKVQVRNSQAVEAWEHVKSKLEGCSMEDSEKCQTVSDQ